MNDEYRGQGGSYLLDPETGKRILIQRTLPADSPETNGTSSSEKTDSDRDGIDIRNRSDSNRNGRGFGEGPKHRPSAK